MALFERNETVRNRYRLIGHTLVGIVIALEGISRLEFPEENEPFIWFCAVAAIIIVASVVFHGSLEKIMRSPHSIPFVLEAIAAFSVGIITLNEGKVYLPYVWFLGGILATGAAIIIFVRSSKSAAPALPQAGFSIESVTPAEIPAQQPSAAVETEQASIPQKTRARRKASPARKRAPKKASAAPRKKRKVAKKKPSSKRKK